MWEAFITQRKVLWTFHRNVHLEWSPFLPTSFHTHNQPIKLFY
jgi:hypothetical protein